ncbi:MAG: NAD(P)H-dependent glycerol-3-phosphate dehydrogenase [Desulfobacterales bacterium]|jgi:glycerol-3-phosphate dehydrogenase (NAD(P)+)|nr:NAD(P)H-dependent glycerol-3-phosphate dehydrogenase [Desulfobacterales bacterium]
MSELKVNAENARIAVVGAGSWGTALACLLAHKGYDIDLWAFEKEVKAQIETRHENETFLPGIPLPLNLRPSNDLSAVIADKDLILLVVPSHLMRAVGKRMAGLLPSGVVLVSAAKGIENDTYLSMSGVLREVLPEVPDDSVAILSGPSFAREVGRKVPTAVTVASKNPATAQLVQNVFSSPHFRVYTHLDVIGVELGGAAKNVIAIASGIVDGLGLGLDTRAALITRGLAEMRRLGVRLGADPRTFSGLSGVGDLILTCTGNLSRNYTVGIKLGSGMTLKAILSEMKMVAEGVKTAKSIFNLSRKIGVEMPICEEVYRILYEEVSPVEAVKRLMTRSLKDEFDGWEG